jgi:hypothetical protein
LREKTMSNDIRYYLEDSFLDIEYAVKKLNNLDKNKNSLSTKYYEETKKELLELIKLSKKAIAEIHLEEL